MKFILLALLLYYIRLKSVLVAGDGWKPAPNCCLSVSNTRIKVENIKNYSLQTKPMCPVNAVRFHTIKHKTICSDPEDDWAKRIMKEIDAGKQPIVPIMCSTSTPTRIPTTPIKTTRPETKTISRTATSISTLPSTVTTLQTTGLQTEIRPTSTRPATESTESSQSHKSSTNKCTEPKHLTETSHKPHGKDPDAPQTTFTSTTKDRTTTKKKRIPKIIQRKRGKSKKQLRKYQMNTPSHG